MTIGRDPRRAEILSWQLVVFDQDEIDTTAFDHPPPVRRQRAPCPARSQRAAAGAAVSRSRLPRSNGDDRLIGSAEAASVRWAIAVDTSSDQAPSSLGMVATNVAAMRARRQAQSSSPGSIKVPDALIGKMVTTAANEISWPTWEDMQGWAGVAGN